MKAILTHAEPEVRERSDIARQIGFIASQPASSRDEKLLRRLRRIEGSR